MSYRFWMMRGSAWAIAVALLTTANLAQAGLELTKEIVGNLTQVPSGQSFTYRLSYRAASTTTNFYNVVLTDVLPPELSYISSQGTAHTTNITYTTGTRTLRVGFVNPLLAGSTGQIDLNVMFKKGSTPNGIIATNQAVLTATNEPTLTTPPVMIRAAATNTVVAAKSLVNPSVPLDQNITYTVSATTPTDVGSLSMTNITLIDSLPAGSVFVSATSGGLYDSLLHTVTWSVPDIVPGTANSQSRSLTVRYPTPVFSLANKVTNVVQVIGTPLGGAPINRFAAVTNTIVAPTAASTFTKDVDGSYVYQDKPISKTYSFNSVKNTGNTTLGNVVVTDTIPAQVWVTDFYSGAYSGSPSGLGTGIVVQYKTNLRGWTTAPGSPFTGSSSIRVAVSALGLAGNETITDLRWSFGDLPATYQITSLKFTGNILPVDRNGNAVITGQTIHNDGTMSYTDFNGPQTKTDPGDITVLSPRPVLQLEKGLVTGSTIAHGTVGSFYVRIRNIVYGAEPLINPVLADLLPAYLTYQPGSMSIYRKPAGAPDPVFETVNNFKGTGQTLLRWGWTNASAYSIPTNDYIEIRFQALEATGTLYGSKANIATLVGWGNASMDSSSTSIGTDNSDLDGDGLSPEPSFYKTFSWTVPSDVSMDSQKWVQGTLNNIWTRYPEASSVPGGRADYRLVVRNTGNVPQKDVVVDDILPFIGDGGVIDLSPRLSEWRPNLAGPVQAPTNVVVYYSTANNPTRLDFVSSGPAGSTPANWSTNPPGNITRVRALRFVFQNYALQPQQSIELLWPMRVPVGAPTGNEIAWNSFGYYATRTDSSTLLLAAEPLKVGIQTVMDTNSAYGDRVWFDANKDGIQQADERGVNGIRVDLWQDSGPQSVPDGIIDTNTDVFIGWTITGDDQDNNAGYYLFPNLAPGSYYAKFAIPDPYVVTTRHAGSDSSFDSDIDPVTHFTPITALADKHKLFVGNLPFSYTSVHLNDLFAEFGEISEALVITDIETGRSKGYGYVTMPDLESANQACQHLNGAEVEGRALVVTEAIPDRNMTFDAGIWLPPYGLTLTKTAGSAPQDDVCWTNPGQTVAYTYTIVNTGLLALIELDLSDDVLGPITNITGPLAPGGSRVITAFMTNVQSDVTNTATVLARPADSNSREVSGAPQAFAQDDAVVKLFAAIGDRVWEDYDADGIQDSGEPGVANVTVTLYDALDQATATKTTAADGSYSFQNLFPADYRVGFQLPAGYRFSPIHQGGNAANDSDADITNGLAAFTTLLSGENDTSWDAGLYRLAAIGDLAWIDTNLNGIQDAGEPGLADMTIRLLDGSGSTLASTNTDSTGHYRFSNLMPGVVAIEFVPPSGFVFTAMDKGGNENRDSDASPTTGRTTLTTLISGEEDLSWDAGLLAPAPSIGIVKTAGSAADGVAFIAECGSDVVYTYVITNTGNTYLKPVTVTDNVLGSIGTLAQPLAPGASATLTATAFHLMTNTHNIATVTATPSDAYGRSLADAITDQDDADVTVSGVFGASRVWLDNNRNGIQEPGEPGIPDVTVILCDAASNEVKRTATDGSGNYSFGEIASGSYTLAFVAPAHYYFTLANQGADDTQDSDPDPLTGRTGAIIVTGGSTQVGWDAGLYRAQPAISLTKTAGSAPDGETLIVYGHSNVTYTYSIKNTGETHLSNLLLSDDKLGAIGTRAGPLAPGAMTTFTVTLTNLASSVTNVATVTATPTDDAGSELLNVPTVTNNDDAVVLVLPRATLSGIVWIDAYRDGLRTPSEPGLLGVTVTLLDSTQTGIATNRTDANGAYHFADILPGVYQVHVLLPSTNWHFTTQDAGSNDSTDSDVTPDSGLTEPIPLASGENATGWDAGVYGGLPPGFCDRMTMGQTFNAIIAGDFEASGGDTEGRLAIGGNARFLFGYSVGFASVGEPIAPASPETDRLIVGNDLYDGSFGVNGNIVFGGTRYGPTRYMTGNTLRAITPVTFTPDGNVPDDGSGMSLSDMNSRLRLASAMIGSMDDHGLTNVFQDTWTLTLQGADPVLNVFNVQAADWNGASKENRIAAPAGSTVIVNIHGSTITLTNGSIVLAGVSPNHVLYNYVDATTVSSASFIHQGAVLAPYANAHLTGGGINGFSFFGGSVNTSIGFEFHNFPFRGTICTEAADLPMIALELTAGSAPDGTVLTLPPGTDVPLTYRITNTGKTWLSDVTVDDREGGMIGALIDPLAPGESAILTRLATAPPTNWTFFASASGIPISDTGERSSEFTDVSATDIASVRMTPADDAEGGGAVEPSTDTARADLAVTGVDFIVKPTLTGDVFSVRITINNHGELDTDAGKLSLYLSEPGAVTSGTPAWVTIDAGWLAAGESKFFIVNHLVAGNVQGTHHLRAFVDSLNSVKEWSDGDNQLAITYALNPIYMGIAAKPEGIALSWNSFWGQNYSLYRSTNMTVGFQLYREHIEATPPTNLFLDVAPVGMSFYRLMVEQP